MEIDGLPELAWLNDLVGEATLAGLAVTMVAPSVSDWFSDPASGSQVRSAPALVTSVAGDFQLSARVTVEFTATFDAGVLFIHQTDDDYAKLCFEYSPDGEPMVVSVVTRGTSDDANGAVVEGSTVWLRVSRLGPLLAFHHSHDGTRWRLTRAFSLRNPDAPLTAGVLAQSPTGVACRATFDQITLTRTTLSDLRDGS